MSDSPTPKLAAVEPAISLTEYCLRLSKRERSVELVNAFFALESHAGAGTATETDFAKRFAAFAARPAA